MNVCVVWRGLSPFCPVGLKVLLMSKGRKQKEEGKQKNNVEGRRKRNFKEKKKRKKKS
jgi:hypothetical protein